MARIASTVQLVIWLGVCMVVVLPVARSAESRKNPPSARALAKELSKALADTTNPARWSKAHAIVQVWAASNPQEAISWTRKHTAGFDQQQLVNAILVEWTRHDPTAAAGYALGLPPEERASSEALRRVVQIWSRDVDPRAALAWVQKLSPGMERDSLIGLAVLGWAEREPEAAAAFALGHPPGQGRASLQYTVAHGWMSKDPPGAWGYALSLPADPQKKALLHALMSSWAYRDPAAALRYVNALPDPDDRRFMRIWLVGRLAEKDRTAALDYARKLTGEDRDSALQEIVRTVAERDPQAAAAIAAEISSAK